MTARATWICPGGAKGTEDARGCPRRMASAALRTRLTVMRSMISEGKPRGGNDTWQVTVTSAAPAAMRRRTGVRPRSMAA